MAQTATVRGVILDEKRLPVENVNIALNNRGTQSNANGFYQLTIAADEKVTITFSHISYENITLNIQLQEDEDYEFNPVMKLNIAQIGEVILTSKKRKAVEGIQSISPEK